MTDAAAQLVEAPPGAIKHDLGWHFPDLSDFLFRLAIPIAPFSWKRARKVITINGHGSLALTSDARRWGKAAAAQLAGQWAGVFCEPIPISIELNAAIVSYLPDRRRVDASNLYQGPEDVMQAHSSRCKPDCRMHAGVITDDWQIRTHYGSDRMLDRERPRIEITLTPYEPGRRAPPPPKQFEMEF